MLMNWTKNAHEFILIIFSINGINWVCRETSFHQNGITVYSIFKEHICQKNVHGQMPLDKYFFFKDFNFIALALLLLVCVTFQRRRARRGAWCGWRGARARAARASWCTPCSWRRAARAARTTRSACSRCPTTPASPRPSACSWVALRTPLPNLRNITCSVRSTFYVVSLLIFFKYLYHVFFIIHDIGKINCAPWIRLKTIK